MSKTASQKKDVHGVLLLDKPEGISSNKALQIAKRLFSARKAGHTGNLDPMATGLLPCCFGDATKVAHFLINSDKTYLARCAFGSRTDTGDATGEVIEQADSTHISAELINSVIPQMLGKQKQIPPMYSALHHEGKRLYEIARAGKTVERKPRDIEVFELSLVSQQENWADFKIKVSKGTYIRTLLEDLAAACNTVAHMTQLRRIQTGLFDATQMVTLEQLRALHQQEHANAKHQLKDHLLPVDQALVEYEKIHLTSEQVQTMIHGQLAEYRSTAGLKCMYDEDGAFLGLGEIDVEGQLKVKRLFYKSYQMAKE